MPVYLVSVAAGHDTVFIIDHRSYLIELDCKKKEEEEDSVEQEEDDK